MQTTKTPGQLAYEEDVRRKPRHHDGSPRETWDDLTKGYNPQAAEVIRQSWESNPTPRNYRSVCDAPCAAKGLTSYRHATSIAGSYVMIGARDHAEALAEANRSLRSKNASLFALEIWDADAGRYVPVTP